MAQTSAPLAIPQLADVKNAIGESPEDLFKRYGRPAKVDDAGTSAGFGLLGGKSITLIHWYDVDGGGRLGFLFRDHYKIGGIAFDNLRSARYLTLHDFFEATPRTSVLESCIQADAFHHMPGDEYDYGSVPLATMVATVTRTWSAPTGGVLVARYRLDGHVRKIYDRVSGTDRLMPPEGLDNLKLLQFAWLPAAGTNSIGDAHPGPDTDLSTLLTPSSDAPCYATSGKRIR